MSTAVLEGPPVPAAEEGAEVVGGTHAAAETPATAETRGAPEPEAGRREAGRREAGRWERTGWGRRQVALLVGVLTGVGVLAYLNRDAIDPSLWRSHLHVGWLLLAAAGSALSLAGCAWNLMGASPVRLRFWPTYGAQAAGTVARLVSPAALGGAAVNVQYLRRAGVGSAASVGTVSVAQTVQLISALVLLPPVAVLAGLSLPGVSFSGTTVWIVLAVAVVLGVLATAAALLLRRRPLLEARVRLMLAELVSSLRMMVRRPRQALVSLAGAVVITVALVGTLWASVHAFGGSVGPLTVAAVLLFGSTAGNAIPVPGGVGTVEAALVAALVAAGVGLTVALPAVALHRLLTLWLQVPAGLFAAALLRRAGAL